jgi:hypothetical protein
MAGGEPRGPMSSSDRSYIFPRHAAEVDRLDLQHFALREALGGDYLAPSGTGRWAAELSMDFPEALVVALDLQPSKPLPFPVGEWGGRVGSSITSDFRAAFARLCEVFQARFKVSREECSELLRDAQHEWESQRSTWAVACAIGRKPAG